MTEEQFKLLNQLVIRPLRELGAEVFIFGSRITDNHHPHSDVDILYRIAVPSGKFYAALSEAKEAIEEESRFPFSVDIVCEKDLAESYRARILAEMKRL